MATSRCFPSERALDVPPSAGQMATRNAGATKTMALFWFSSGGIARAGENNHNHIPPSVSLATNAATLRGLIGSMAALISSCNLRWLTGNREGKISRDRRHCACGREDELADYQRTCVLLIRTLL